MAVLWERTVDVSGWCGTASPFCVYLTGRIVEWDLMMAAGLYSGSKRLLNPSTNVSDGAFSATNSSYFASVTVESTRIVWVAWLV